MRVLAMIHAKKGSKRFPGKHRELFRGQTMVQRLVDQAKECDQITDVVVCTNDDELLKTVDVGWMVQTPLDESKPLTVRNDMIPDTISRWRRIYKVTEPLAWININGLIIDEFLIPKCCDKLLKQVCGTVQSVEEVDHHHPNYLFRGSGVGLMPYCMAPEEYIPSQMFEKLWAGVGACIGGYDPPRPGPRAGVFLSKYSYFELHDPIELEVARGLYEYQRGHPALENCEAETHEQT